MGISSHLRGVSGSLGKFQRRCRRSLVFRVCQGRFRESSLSLEGVSNYFENISGELRGNFESVSGVPWAFQENFRELQKRCCEFIGTSGVFQGAQRKLEGFPVFSRSLKISGIFWRIFECFRAPHEGCVSGEFSEFHGCFKPFERSFREPWNVSETLQEVSGYSGAVKGI